MWTEQSVTEYCKSKGVEILWGLPQPPLAYYSIKLSRGAAWSDRLIGIHRITDQRTMQRMIDDIDMLANVA